MLFSAMYCVVDPADYIFDIFEMYIIVPLLKTIDYNVLCFTPRTYHSLNVSLYPTLPFIIVETVPW